MTQIDILETEYLKQSIYIFFLFRSCSGRYKDSAATT